MTYHFGSLTELLAAAFTRHVDTVAARFDERMRTAPDRAAALEALVEHLTGDLLGSGRDLVLAVELYTAAARNPTLRAVTQDWMSRSRRSLERHVRRTPVRRAGRRDGAAARRRGRVGRRGRTHKRHRARPRT